MRVGRSCEGSCRAIVLWLVFSTLLLLIKVLYPFHIGTTAAIAPWRWEQQPYRFFVGRSHTS